MKELYKADKVDDLLARSQEAHTRANRSIEAGRVSRLEADMLDVKGVLGRLEPLLVRIDTRVSELPSAVEFGELKGRVSALPTAWQLVGILVAASALIFSLVKWVVPALTSVPAP